VGKCVEDLEYALKSDILMFNVESIQEILKLDEVAGKMGKKARMAIRVNPDVDPKTHPYISTGLKQNKFGIDIREAHKQYAVAASLKNLEVSGVSCHIGSQLTQISPFIDTL
jgi:diaminopimelate decarboxylase